MANKLWDEIQAIQNNMAKKIKENAIEQKTVQPTQTTSTYDNMMNNVSNKMNQMKQANSLVNKIEHNVSDTTNLLKSQAVKNVNKALPKTTVTKNMKLNLPAKALATKGFSQEEKKKVNDAIFAEEQHNYNVKSIKNILANNDNSWEKYWKDNHKKYVNSHAYEMGITDSKERQKIINSIDNSERSNTLKWLMMGKGENNNTWNQILGKKENVDTKLYLTLIQAWKDTDAGKSIKGDIDEIEKYINEGDIYKAYNKIAEVDARERQIYSKYKEDYKKFSKDVWFKESDALKNGFSLGGLLDTIYNSTQDVAGNILIGGGSALGSLGDFTMDYINAPIADLFGQHEMADEMRELSYRDMITEHIRETEKLDEADKNSVFGNRSDSVAQGVGNTLFNALGTMGLGKIGALTAIPVKVAGHTLSMPVLSVLSGMGSGYADAYKQGAEKWQASLKGGLSGIVEGVSEGLFEFLGVGGSSAGKAVDDALKGAIKNRLGSGIAQTATLMGLQAGEEASEEAISYIGDYITGQLMDYITNQVYTDTDYKLGKGNVKFSKEFNSDEMWDDFWSGFFSTLISGAPGEIKNGLQRNYQNYQQQKQQNAINDSNNLTNEENLQNLIKDKKINLPGLKNELLNTANNIRNSLSEKMAQNGNTAQIEAQAQNNANNEQNQPLEYYESVKKSNINMANKKIKHNIDSIYNLMNERGIKASYDASRFNNDSEVAFWHFVNEDGSREIVINPNADTNKALNQIIMHEATHDLVGSQTYQDMKKALLDYAKIKPDFKEAYETLTEKYLKQYEGRENKAELIEDEAVADIIGQKFGNQEFIDSIVNTNRNLAQKIYQHIKEAVQNIRAKFSKNYGEQLRFWQGIEEQWKKAFNGQYNDVNSNNKRFMSEQSNYNIPSNISIKDSQGREIDHNIHTYSTSSYSGQVNMVKEFQDEDGNTIAKIDYSYFDNDIYINMIETNQEYRRKGLATRLLQDLKQEAKEDNSKIHYGYSTDDGTAFLNAVNVEKNKEKMYNKITKAERNQIVSEVMTWRNNEEDGIHYIDLSKNGYNSYIYSKKNGEIKPLKKIVGSEEFKNFIRKGVENGAFTSTEGFNKSIAEIRSQYRRYSTGNDSLSEGNSDNRNDKLPTRQIRGKENSNTTRNIKSDFKDGGLDDSSSFNLPSKPIQGLENYTRAEIKEITNKYIEDKLEENGLDGISIIDSEIHGSRNRGTAKKNSDLDIVVEYDGDIREDDLFDILHEDSFYLDGIKVDINPITANKTGTLREYMENSRKYDQEVLNKKNLPTEKNKRMALSENNKELEDSSSLNLPKVQEGYTRLYRGYENEYNSSYDKNKLDNVNGYESWTDNYDLAKSYGDNVYFIDVPTSSIKNSVIDEDSTSETYGDRNLIYKNDKPAGINGKSGNEYMLYTDHDKHNNINRIKIENQKNNLPTTDSNGKVLSKEQQEYFKDSKVRDKDGKLLTAYHGTEANVGIPKEHWFSIFDEDRQGNHGSWFGNGFYFTTNLEHAKDYAHSKGNIYETYINITNPYIPYKNVDSTISFQEDFKNNFKEAQKINGKLDGKQIQEILKNNNYDGIIIGDDIIAFNSNQIKNIDNKNPTKNPDIRYSVSENTKETNLPTTDNKGNLLSKKQQDYFKDSKARDENGKLEEVYHTTTNKIAQFNEFNPVGTNYYRFGDQVVNYYTNSKEMSGSYADGLYEKADTRKINNINDLQNQIDEINNDIKDFYSLSLNENKDGSYTATLEYNKDADKTFGVISDEIKKLKETDFTTYNKLVERAKTSENGYRMFSGLGDTVDEFLYKMGSLDPKGYTAGETANLVKQYLTKDILGEVTYSNKDDLFRHFKEKLQKEFPRAIGMKNYQYSGYVNIKNPFIIDAEERNWNQVINESNEFIDNLVDRVPDETKNELTRLYNKSQNISGDLRERYENYKKIIDKINEDTTLSKDTKNMNHLVKRLGVEATNNLYDGSYDTLSVNDWNVITDVLETDGVIGHTTANFINNEWRLPENIKEWINNEYTKRISIKNVVDGAEYFTSLKELYEDNSKAYNEFSKYRYPQDYFIEKISGNSNAEDFVDIGSELEDIFETRAEIVGAYQVAEELAKASSVAFSRPEMIRLWGNSKTTNDIVKEIIASNKDGKTNYDGVIIKNVRDYGGKSESNVPADLYITFNSNQFKAQDNTNPTDDKDIRYSKDKKANAKENVDKWQQWLEKNIAPKNKKDLAIKDMKLPTKQSVEDAKENKNASNIKLDASVQLKTEKNDNYLSSKAQNYKKRIENTFKNNIVEKLETSKYINKDILNDSIKELETEYKETGNITDETIDRVFNNMYSNLKKIDTDYYDQYKDVKKAIKNTKLYVPDDVKSSIADYNDFRQYSRGRLTLTNDSNNMDIDTYYQELSHNYPELFPDDIYNPADQLEQMSEVTKDIAKVETNVEAYSDNILGKDYRDWAKREYEYEVDRMKKQWEIINRYTTDQENKRNRRNGLLSDEAIDNMELNEVKGLYEMQENYQKQYDKINNKELLTEKDRNIVDRLIKDKMTVDQILPGYNKEGILKVYKAKQGLDFVNQEIKEYKARTKQKIDMQNELLIADIEKWKDKKIGKLYSRETALRNIQDIMDKKSAEAVNNSIFKPILENESNRIRFVNEKAKQIDDLNIDKKKKYKYEGQKVNEADLAGLYIEQKVTEQDLEAQGADVNKIKKIANTFSEILNESIDAMEAEYLKYGYAPVHRIKNYFPHFVENKPDGILSKISSKLGIRTGLESLPTDIAGKTDTFKPGRTWNSHILERKTDVTDIDAMKVMDTYIKGASDVMYHTEDLQKLRSLERTIRNVYADKETKARIDNIKQDDSLTLDEKMEAIEKIQEQIKNPLPNFVTWLNDYTNTLANKKSKSDRAMEQEWGRQTYTTMQDLEGKIASNMIGGNISVSLTNFAPLFQAMGTTKVGNVLTGMVETTADRIQSMFGRGDGFVDNSDFLTARRGEETIAMKKWSQKLSDKMGIPMQTIDNFVSESIVRAKYRENLHNGMSEEQALKKADQDTANIMADRRKGALPTIFNSKNPMSKAFTMFQVEPNNIISNYTKDMIRSGDSKAQLLWNFTKLAVASYAFNTILKSIRGGSDVLPDPVGIVSELVKYYTSDDDDEKKKAGDSIITDILGSMPFGSVGAIFATALGLDIEGIESAGRLPVQSAVPNMQKVSKLFDSSVAKEYKKQVMETELAKPLLYLGLPTGGAQINKTIQGIKTLKEGGNYSYNTKGEKQLKFPVAKTPGNVIKATVFGKYATEEGKKYVEDFKGMNAKQTELYDKTDIDFYDLQKYFDYSSGKSKEEKINYINNNFMNISDEDRWNLFEYNVISNTKREDGTSQVDDARYITYNGTSKNDYMKVYEKLTKNDMSMIDKDDYMTLKKNGISLDTYANYKINVKDATKKANKKTLKDTEKYEVLTKTKGTSKEKQAIFENYLAKDDNTYKRFKKSGGNYTDYIKYKELTKNDTKQAQKIKHLVNSDFSDKTIARLYENCVLDANSDNTEYEMVKEAGINTKEYLKYKMQDFSSDKQDDGTVNGKTVSGSKKKKVMSYINSMNISYNQKLLLAGMNYSLTKAEKEKIFKYVNSLNISGAEKRKILGKVKGFTIYKNGKVTW